MKSKLIAFFALLGTACVLAGLSACSHSPRRVDCTGHLEPINPVLPKK